MASPVQALVLKLLSDAGIKILDKSSFEQDLSKSFESMSLTDTRRTSTFVPASINFEVPAHPLDRKTFDNVVANGIKGALDGLKKFPALIGVYPKEGSFVHKGTAMEYVFKYNIVYRAQWGKK
jgi:hypothetical protein